MADNIGGKDGSEATFGGRLTWQDRYDRQILGPGRSNGESGKGQTRSFHDVRLMSELPPLADPRMSYAQAQRCQERSSTPRAAAAEPSSCRLGGQPNSQASYRRVA